MTRAARSGRALFFTAAVSCAALGLCLRRFGGALPSFFATYAPDAVWAMMVYCGFGFLLCQKPQTHALCALVFCTAIECSQLYHAPWIDALRATTLGGLVLGYGFLWRDLACYAIGIALCFAAESAVRRPAHPFAH